MICYIYRNIKKYISDLCIGMFDIKKGIEYNIGKDDPNASIKFINRKKFQHDAIAIYATATES